MMRGERIRLLDSQGANVYLKHKVLFFIAATIIQVALLLKSPLFLLREFSPQTPQVNNTEFSSQTPQDNNTQGKLSPTAYLTSIVYFTLYISRFFEGLVAEVHVYNFFFKQTTVDVTDFRDRFLEKMRGNKCLVALFVTMVLYMFILFLTVPALGICLEIQGGGNLYIFYILYWILDVVKYIYIFVIHLLMVVATIVITSIWRSQEDFSAKIDTYHEEPVTYADYLLDRKVTNCDHKLRTEDYSHKGRQVKEIAEIFQTWFIIPWIIYLIGSTLDPDHILRVWQEEETKKSEFDLPEIFFLIDNINELFMLFLTYICTKIINVEHTQYMDISRGDQLKKFKSASRMGLASLQKIEKNKFFNFESRIWGTSVWIDLDGEPLFVVFLLIGIFFTIYEAVV